MRTPTNIMIIDDSFTNRVLLKAVLDDLEMNVIEVNNGLKALRILEDSNPDIILLDMCMPQMDGLDFLQELRIRKSTIPVVVISVLDDHNYIREAFQSGASEYLLKPLEINKLLNAIARFTEYEYIKS